jgi:chromosome segregation ATPase
MKPGGVVRYHGNYDYYLQKAAELGGDTYNASGSMTAADADKQRRIEQNRERQDLRAEIRRLDRRIQQAEEQIIDLEARRDELSSQLSNPAAGADFAGLSREIAGLQNRIEESTREWESCATVREEMVARLEAGESA